MFAIPAAPEGEISYNPAIVKIDMDIAYPEGV
jgi:hypothetical protein